MKDFINIKGFIVGTIRYKDRIEYLKFNNSIVANGKKFMAGCLLENPSKKPVFIANMLFGDGGVVNGSPKQVDPFQEKLNGVVRLKKQVVAQIDPEVPTQVIFTVNIGEQEGNDFTLNEMGLELSNGELFSLTTFTDFNKTEEMDLTWEWIVAGM